MLDIYFQNKSLGDKNCFFSTPNSHGASMLVTLEKQRRYSFAEKKKDVYSLIHSFVWQHLLRTYREGATPCMIMYIMFYPLHLQPWMSSVNMKTYQISIPRVGRNVYKYLKAKLLFLIENQKLVFGVHVHIHIFFSWLKIILHICAQDEG